MPTQSRPLLFLVDSLKVLKRFSVAVQDEIGFELYNAQIGKTTENAKRLHGFAIPVWEVRVDDRTGTFRAAYVVHLKAAVYVLHIFQKKSKSGIETPLQDIDLIRQRLKLAREIDSKERKK